MAAAPEQTAAKHQCFTLTLSDKSLTIDGYVNGEAFNMLLDTGSSLSLINYSVICKFKDISISSCNLPMLKLANGAAMAPIGFSQLDLIVNNVTYKQLFYIYNNIPFDILLGLDFCKMSKINIDFEKLTVNNLTNVFPFNLHLLIEEDKDNSLYMRNDVNIGPEQGQFIELYSFERIPDTLLFDLNSNFNLKTSLIIHNSIIKSEQGNVKIFVINTTNSNILIRKNTKIGSFEPIEEKNCFLLEADEVKKMTAVDATAAAKDNDTIYSTQTIDMRSNDGKIIFNVGEELPIENKLELVKFLNNFRGIFACDTSELTRTNLTTHKIITLSDEPVQRGPYRASWKERDEMQKQVKEMLAAGLIRESKSPYAAPVVMVKKSNGALRMCHDYRGLNAVTKCDSYPLPRIEDLMNSFSGAKMFTTLDMASGYHQIPVDPESIEKTAFITPFGLFEYEVLPFGLSTACETYQRMVDKLIAGLKYTHCVGYLDDIIIWSVDFPQHLERLGLVFDRIKNANLKLQPQKCSFGKKEIKYLGWTVSAEGTKPDENKVIAVKHFPRPTTKKEIKRFLGMIGYYRSSIDKFAMIAEPLHGLLRKTAAFDWTEREEAAFITLKDALCKAPVLVHFSNEIPVKLFTDASYDGIAFILSHEIDGKEHPFKYGSRSLSNCEINYGVTELECLAIVWSVTKNRHYLLGAPFEIVSDHHSLCWLLRARNPSAKLCRWALRLSEFDFKIVYKSGKTHMNVDALSRAPVSNISTTAANGNTYDEDRDLVEEFPFLNSSEINLVAMQRSDDWCSKIHKRLEESRDKPLRMGGKEFILIEGIIYRCVDDGYERYQQLLVPKELRKEILWSLHDDRVSGHLGIAKTYDRLRRRFYWPKMFRSVYRYVNRCIDCQGKKKTPGRKYGLGQMMETPVIPFETVGCDLLGKFKPSNDNKSYIVVCTDHCSRFVVTAALEDIKAETVAKFLIEKVVLIYGEPKKILTDQGKQFTSALMQSILDTVRTKHIRTTSYHPQTNAIVENFNKTLANMLAAYCDADQSNWSVALPYVTHAYNTVKHISSNHSPFYLLFGWEPRHMIDCILNLPGCIEAREEIIDRVRDSRELARELIKEVQFRNKVSYDEKRSVVDFKVGDKVLVYTPLRKVGLSEKFIYRYFGPFTVKELKSPVNVRVESEDGTRKEVVHVCRLKRFNEEYDENIDNSSNEIQNFPTIINTTQEPINKLIKTKSRKPKIQGKQEKCVKFDKNVKIFEYQPEETVENETRTKSGRLIRSPDRLRYN